METYLYKHFYAILVMMRKVDKKVFMCFLHRASFHKNKLVSQLLLENSQKRIKITKKWFITKKKSTTRA